MTEPFEDPRKTEMRDRCEIAIDIAGHELVGTPTSIPARGVKGKLKGDLQSLDGQEVRHIYYLRTEASKSVPVWLVSFARAAEQLDLVRVHAVTIGRGATLERSCRAARVSLLLLDEDNSFERLVDPAELDEVEAIAAHTARCKEARRRMETKLRLNTSAIERNYSQVTELTTGMASEVREQYIRGVTVSAAAWDDWSQRVSTLLDEALATRSDDPLDAAEKLIEDGVVDDA